MPCAIPIEGKTLPIHNPVWWEGMSRSPCCRQTSEIGDRKLRRWFAGMPLRPKKPLSLLSARQRAGTSPWSLLRAMATGYVRSRSNAGYYYNTGILATRDVSSKKIMMLSKPAVALQCIKIISIAGPPWASEITYCKSSLINSCASRHKESAVI